MKALKRGTWTPERAVRRRVHCPFSVKARRFLILVFAALLTALPLLGPDSASGLAGTGSDLDRAHGGHDLPVDSRVRSKQALLAWRALCSISDSARLANVRLPGWDLRDGEGPAVPAPGPRTDPSLCAVIRIPLRC